MSASDLPDMRYSSGEAMARTLVTYIDDAGMIRSRIREDFDRSPDLRTIERMRAAYLATLRKPKEPPFKIHEGHYPAEVSERAAAVSVRFVEAIERERALSVAVAKANGALNDTFLTNPRLVDEEWDSETEAAWRQNGELQA